MLKVVLTTMMIIITIIHELININNNVNTRRHITARLSLTIGWATGCLYSRNNAGGGEGGNDSWPTSCKLSGEQCNVRPNRSV